MNFAMLLNWRIWVALGLVIALAASHWKAYSLGGASERAARLADQLEISKQSLRAVEKTMAKTADLQAQAEKIDGDKDAQINSLAARVDTLNQRLRQRPERPNHLPATASAGQAAGGCTGAQLYRDDSSVLVGEAAAADTLRIALKACYAQYDAARAALK